MAIMIKVCMKVPLPLVPSSSANNAADCRKNNAENNFFIFTPGKFDNAQDYTKKTSSLQTKMKATEKGHQKIEKRLQLARSQKKSLSGIKNHFSLFLLFNILYNDVWYRIFRTKEFKEWFLKETEKSQFQIGKRLALIETEEYFGTHKPVTDFVWKLKWKNGRRVYYAYLEEANLLLLLGGNKNGQNKDIKQAKKILTKYQDGVS